MIGSICSAWMPPWRSCTPSPGETELTIERSDQGLRRAAGSSGLWQARYLHMMSGYALFQQGAGAASTQALNTALTMKADLSDFPGTSMCLEILAWVAASQRRHRRAAWLIGATDEMYKTEGPDVTVDD